MPGAPQNILDAGAQEYYPAVGAIYPFQPLQHQQLYCPPVPYPVMPPPAPMPMAMPVPVPPPQTVAIPQQFGIHMPAPVATAAVDGPPSRAVVLSLLPPHAPEAEVARAMAPFGDVRAVDSLALASEGVATVHFFDLRHAERAVAAVRQQHMRQQCRLSQYYAATAAAAAWPAHPPPAWDWQQDDGFGLVLGQAVWANFAAASTLPDDGANRGSLVVLNSLPDVSLSELRQAFQAYGTHPPATTEQFLPHPDRILQNMFDLCVSVVKLQVT
jgi:hypothetical protein